LKKLFLPVTVILITMSFLAKFMHASLTLQFILSCLAIIPLAGLMGRSTESMAAHVGPRVGGLISASFGNAVELIIGIFALKAGLINLVKASITGSILGNLLFVLGVSFFVGGIRHPIQRFNIRAARNQGSMLILGVVIAFILPEIFSTRETHVSLALSGVVAVVSFLLYVSGLLFTLITHQDIFDYMDSSKLGDEEEDTPWRLRTATSVLVLATILVSLESDWLVESVKHIATQLGWSEAFIGIVVVAVVGNAAEHASAVWMAWKDRMDLSLEIAIGSSLQVAMFIAPILFFTSLFLGNPMPLLFSWPELASMFAAVLLVVVLMLDGESNWLEGAMAVGAYVVMAVGFSTLPGL
jgi:Ca2+:H+ antiporter